MSARANRRRKARARRRLRTYWDARDAVYWAAVNDQLQAFIDRPIMVALRTFSGYIS